MDLNYNFYFMHGYLILTPSGQKFQYKIFQVFAKNEREGGVQARFRIFPELGEVLGCNMPNFRSLGQSLHIDNFCKNREGGGRGGPYYPFGPQSLFFFSPSCVGGGGLLRGKGLS